MESSTIPYEGSVTSVVVDVLKSKTIFEALYFICPATTNAKVGPKNPTLLF